MSLIMSDRRLYWIWFHMKDRCYNPRNPSFADYGGKGIKVCDQWTLFPYFESWARASGYENHLTINRIDNNKGYSPANCDWITKEEQCRNRTFNYTMKDGTLACDAARANGIKHTTWIARVKKGWSIEDAVSIPVHKKPKKLDINQTKENE